MSGNRLDRELVNRGLARSRAHAQQLIAAGSVAVNGRAGARASDAVDPADEISAPGDPYVSRAAHKLLGALDDLGLGVGGRVLDAGASTGGFTQVLLERGCAPVYAVDVGTDQLADSLRNDPRVVVRERTNLRDLELRHVGGHPVDLVVADVSFISLVLLVQPLAAVTRPDGRLLLLVKPQFEVGRQALGKGGVVRDRAQHHRAVEQVVDAGEKVGWYATRAARSRLLGPAGNVEYFVLFESVRPGVGPDLEATVAGDS